MTTGATRTRHGCRRVCAGGSWTSPRCSAADTRQSWTSVPRPGGSRIAGARRLALSFRALRSPLGAARLAKAHPSLGSARHESVDAMLFPIQVVQLSFFRDPEGRPPGALLGAWPTLVDVADADAPEGSASAWSRRIRTGAHARGGVHYHFLPFGEGTAAAPSEGLGELLRRLAPDLFHVHGLGFARDVLALASLAPGTPIIVQDHANRPPRFWRRRVWRREMAIASGVAFCAWSRHRPFDAGLIGRHSGCTKFPNRPAGFCRDRVARRARSPGSTETRACFGWGTWTPTRTRLRS